MEKDKADFISDAGLESEDFLVLHIGDNFSRKAAPKGDTIRTKNSEIWFFQVADYSFLDYGPFRLRDNNGNLVGPISPNSGISYQRFRDSDGDDILRIEDFRWRVNHYSVGVKQDDVWIYPRVPDNQNGGGISWAGGSEPDPTQGDVWGKVESGTTPYSDPSLDLESLVWHNEERSTNQYGFYNADNTEPVDPVLSIKGYAYELRPVIGDDQKLRLLADMSRRDHNRQTSMKVVEFSRSALRTYGYTVPSPWEDAGNRLNIEKANLPSDVARALKRTPEEAEDIVDEEGINIGRGE